MLVGTQWFTGTVLGVPYGHPSGYFNRVGRIEIVRFRVAGQLTTMVSGVEIVRV